MTPERVVDVEYPTERDLERERWASLPASRPWDPAPRRGLDFAVEPHEIVTRGAFTLWRGRPLRWWELAFLAVVMAVSVLGRAL